MEDALRFLRTYEMWIYLILAGAGLIYIRRFILAWEEMRAAAFGLERESAQSRLNHAAGMLVLILITTVIIFSVVSFVVPTLPGTFPLLTPTIDLAATVTHTLPPAGGTGGPAETVMRSEAGAEGTPIPTVTGEGCTPGQVEITAPLDGSEISGVVVITGTADIPNFGFYKYEVARPGETIWLPIQAGQEIKRNQELGQWDTRALASGDYMLRLVVSDNQGETMPPCIIHVRINNPVTP